MPPKKARMQVTVKPEEYVLRCEWMTCEEVFQKVDDFISHVTKHLSQFINQVQVTTGEEDLTCQWRDCGSEVEGWTSGFMRHIYFHVFHVKIKCIGELLIQKTAIQPCLLDRQSRNLIPELPEKLQCSWQQCDGSYENADIFYRHVEAHADYFPDGNNIPGGCTCVWQGCGLNVRNKYKLREHLRSHTQEKVVACPTCGGLFASRTKFFDHLRRQGGNAGKRYQCSHCNKVFATERLLRDHMRHHVNQYKCPYCDMTSPSPSCIRLHLKYRHIREKPFKCETCDYGCKSMSDLRKHTETHKVDAPFRCQVEKCDYRARGYQSLANHFKRVHQSVSVSNYICHVCNKMFTRGAMLTKHLKKKHKFNWPSGHSRFRYKLHPDGLWRLQTVRYESIELNTEDHDSNSNGKTADEGEGEMVAGPSGMADLGHDDANGSSVDFDANNTMEEDDYEGVEFSNQTGVISMCTEENDDLGEITENESQCEGQTFVDEGQGHENALEGHPDTEIHIHQAGGEDGNITEIMLTTDDAGRVVITTDKYNSELGPVTITMPSGTNFEENMYNLQMLGEVALKDPNR